MINFSKVLFLFLAICVAVVGCGESNSSEATKSSINSKNKKYISQENEKVFLDKIVVLSITPSESNKDMVLDMKEEAMKIVKNIIKSEGINSLTENDRTFIFHAASSKNHEIVEYLINNGADINISDDANITPLQEAVKRNSLDIVKLLVENGAKIHAKDNFSRSALSIAKYSEKYEILTYLESIKENKNTMGTLSKGKHEASDYNIQADYIISSNKGYFSKDNESDLDEVINLYCKSFMADMEFEFSNRLWKLLKIKMRVSTSGFLMPNNGNYTDESLTNVCSYYLNKEAAKNNPEINLNEPFTVNDMFK